MAVKGKTRTFTGYSPKVGFFRSRVLMINPTLEEISKYQDISNMKEPEYLGEFEDSNDNKTYKKVTIVFWLQAVDKDGKDIPNVVFRKIFTLIDKVRTNKDGDKTQFINNIGSCTWAKSKEDLKQDKYSWFTKREFRESLAGAFGLGAGEEKLYMFLQKWLSLDYTDPDTELSFDTKPFFKGKFKELQNLLNLEYKDHTTFGNATIHTAPGTVTEENPEPTPKVYQNVWDEFLPGNIWDVLEKPIRPNWIQLYIDRMEGDYGCKDYFITDLMRDYDPDENPTTASSSLHTDPANIPSGDIKDDLPF